MSVLEEKFGAKKKKAGEEEEIKDVETKTILHSKQTYKYLNLIGHLTDYHWLLHLVLSISKFVLQIENT